MNLFASLYEYFLQSVSMWLFDKKDIEKWPKDDKELFLNIIKKGVGQLTRLRHPRLLIVEHGIEESRLFHAYLFQILVLEILWLLQQSLSFPVWPIVLD